MNLIIECARLLALLMPGLWLAAPGLADDGDGANLCQGLCTLEAPHDFGVTRDHSRPGSVIVFPLFVSGGGDTEECGAGNVLVNRKCLPRTEIELGATCPTRFTVGNQNPVENPNNPNLVCAPHQTVRVRFRWVCPGIQDFEHQSICKTGPFDVSLTVNGKVVFTANGFRLPDGNQVTVPAAPCEKGYLIGWVIKDDLPIKYDGLIGEAVIRNSGTAIAAYRGITIQAYAETDPGDTIKLVPDTLGSQRLGLPFLGEPDIAFSERPYRVITGQVTGDVTFDKPPPDGPQFGVSTSLILLTLDVRSNSPNFPTSVLLDFWNGSGDKLSPSPSVQFLCWGEFQLSTDIDPNLTQAIMGTRKGLLQSGEANTSLLGLAQINEIPENGPIARMFILEFYNNGILFPPTLFFP